MGDDEEDLRLDTIDRFRQRSLYGMHAPIA
jgi:hypothetical protein